jgi:hypothetical protein
VRGERVVFLRGLNLAMAFSWGVPWFRVSNYDV